MVHLHKNLFDKKFKEDLIKKIKLDKTLSTKEKSELINNLEFLLSKIKREMKRITFLKTDLDIVFLKLKKILNEG